MSDPETKPPAAGPVVRSAPQQPTFDIPEALETPFDAHGFDPAEFEWRPVARRPRTDGWTPDVQRRFIQALAETGQVNAAAQAVDMSVQSAYRLRVAPGSEGFARAWAAAIHAAADRLTDLAFTRAIEGDEQPIFDRDGIRIGSQRRYSDRLLIFLLRAHRAERYGIAHRLVDPVATPLPRAELPLSEASARLGLVQPAEPHRLMTPEKLGNAVYAARGVAEVHARYPIDTSERYVRPLAEASHPEAHARQRRSNAREQEAEARRLERQNRQAAAECEEDEDGSWDQDDD